MTNKPLRQPNYERHSLTDQQFLRALALWEADRSLGEIAEEVGCQIYQLGFLYRELLPYMRRLDITPIVQGQDPKPAKYKSLQDAYAIGFRDHDGYESGPFSTLKEALDVSPDEGNIIARLTDPPQVVAVWDAKRLCWVVTGKRRQRDDRA